MRKLKEIFKPIYYKGKLTHYEVSNYGKVRNTKSKRILRPVDLNGYSIVRLSDKSIGLKPKTTYVHRLVATAFIPNPENKKEVNHIDLNRSNNHVSNLEWVTTEENYNHAVINGAFKDSIYEPINDEDVEKIGKMLESGMYKYQILKEFPQYPENSLRMLFFRPSKKDKKILSKYNIIKHNNRKGQFNSRAKISDNEVKNIIKDMLNGMSNKAIAEKYKTTVSIVGNIRAKDTWTHLTKGLTFPRGIQNDALLDRKTAKKIVELLNKNYTKDEIVEKLNVRPYHVKRIKLKRIYADLTEGMEFINKQQIKLIKRVIYELIEGRSIKSVLHGRSSITYNDILDIINHRKYQELTKGIIFCGINKNNKFNKIDIKSKKKLSSSKIIIKFKNYNFKRRCHRAFERFNITNQIKKKISNKQDKLIIKFKNSKYKQKCYKQFNGSESRYDINMKLLNKDPEKKALLDNIISLIMKGKTNKEIDKELNIKRDFVNHIRTKDKYGWYTEGLEFPDIYKSPHTDQMFKDVADLIMMKYRDKEIIELLSQYNLTRTTICAIRQHRMGRELLKDYDFPVLPRDKKIDKNKLKIKFRINGKVL